MPELFKTKVRKVGTSLGLLIPKEFARKEGIREGEGVEVGLLKETRLRILQRAFGSAKGAGAFVREKSDRVNRY